MKNDERYFGSVRFFKNMILLCCILGVLIPSALVFYWSGRAKRAEVAAQNTTAAESTAAASESEEQQEEQQEEENGESGDTTEEIGYQSLYPDFYAPTPLPEVKEVENKTIYLTFDDGPSERTDEVLKILDRKNVKATFFVVGKEDEESIERIRKAAAAGHTIGMHSYSHDYETIYGSVEDFLADFYKLFVFLRDEVGVTPTVFRFPGGSLNSYDQGIYQEIIAEMLRRGFRYYDWNLSAEDAIKNSPSADTIVEGITKYSSGKKHGVVLMHDSSHCETTVEALPTLIDTLKEQGFVFAALDRTVRPISFHYQAIE